MVAVISRQNNKYKEQQGSIIKTQASQTLIWAALSDSYLTSSLEITIHF